jgi:hypothetical protein
VQRFWTFLFLRCASIADDSSVLLTINQMSGLSAGSRCRAVAEALLENDVHHSNEVFNSIRALFGRAAR